MIVFIVMPGWDYEGADEEAVKVFRTREGAEAYADTLRSNYDWIEIEGRELGE
jgi:hypothetical protein